MKKFYTSLHFLILLIFVGSTAQGQKFQFSTGINVTDYSLVNTNNQLVDYLKPGSGFQIKAGFYKPFLDTLSLQLNSPETALKYTQRPVLSKLLSILTYSAALQLNQFNAIGDIQQIPLKYETNYAGLELGLGAKLSIMKKVGIHLKGILSANKLLYGSQMTGNKFYLLKGIDQFDGIKLMKGFQIDLSTKINPTTDFIVAYSNYSSLSSSEATTGKLDLSTQTFTLGLAFQISKK